MAKRIFKIVSIVLISIAAICLIYIAIPFTGLFVHGIIEGLKYDPSQAPKPEITYGEFQLELTYTINDKTIKVSDIYVCEYVGYNESMNSPNWSGVMKSTKEDGFVLYDKDRTKIYCMLGYPEYYMGEIQEKPTPVIWIEKKGVVFGAASGIISEKQLLEKYSIEIKEWKTAPPIENSFKEFEKAENGSSK